MTDDSIPFHRPSIGAAERAAAIEVLESGWLTTGSKTAAFEEAFRSFVGVDDGIEAALACARERGAATVAAHPYRNERAASESRTTQRFARDWQELGPLLDRYELFNGRDLYPWVAEHGLPGIATGTSTGPSTCSAGRRSSRAPSARRRSSRTCARPHRCTSHSSIAPGPRARRRRGPAGPAPSVARG